MKSLIIFLLFSIFVSCSKEDNIFSSCIEQVTENNDCITEVYEYDYNGEKVYSFVAGNGICSDALSFIVDESCNNLCVSGGFSGSDDCTDLWGKLSNQKLIWEK